MENPPADYDPMQMFADIALSTAPPSFIASRSQSASHAPTAAQPSNLRSTSIPSSSSPSGLVSATWSADGYPTTRNGNYNTAYPSQNVHAMNNDSFRTVYSFERRTSATRLEPPMKSPVMVKTPAPIGDSYLNSAPPLGRAASPRSKQLSFPLVTAGYRPERSNKGRAKKDAKENATPKDAGTGKGAGSSRDGRGSRNTSARGRGAASNRQNSRKSRARALSPIKDTAEIEKPSEAKAQPAESNISDVINVNGGAPQISPVRQNPITSATIESTDPPSPSPAYSPFPSRPNSPVYEPPEAIPPDSEEVIRVKEPQSSSVVTEHVPAVNESDNTPDAQLAAEDSVMKDIEEPKEMEAPVDGSTARVLNEELASKSTEESASIFSKPSPDSGAIVLETSQERTEAHKQEVSISEDVEMRKNIPDEMEISTPKDKDNVRAVEEVTDEPMPQSISPNEEVVLSEEAAEKANADIPTIDVQLMDPEVVEEIEEDLMIKENEDFEFAQAVGDEPIFGLGDSLNNGLPVTAFDSSQEAELGDSAATGSGPVQEERRQLSIVSPSGELSREPGDPDNEICGECDTKYRDSFGFRLDQVAWIGCDGCGKWYHSHCLKLDDTTVKRIDKFYCAPCEPKYGKSTMKRTSTRATTAIDYNALHNGSSAPIKNPNDSKLHPYVAIIRDRTHTFAADTLPRLRPEQVTVEFIDDMPTGWNQPFVVPATENPAPWIDLSEGKPKDEQPPSEPTPSQQPRTEQDYLNMSITPEPSFPVPVPVENPDMQLQAPPAPPRSPTTNQDQRGNKKVKGNSPEITLENGGFDQKEVNRIKKTLVEGEYDVKERREGADCLDMIIPKGLSVRKVGELVGAQMQVEMINVLRQSTTKEDKWNMDDLVRYFETKERTDIYNCISCEVTNTPLGAEISRPEVVRKLDLSDKVWRPSNENDVKPHVGKYVLMSVADSFTDFHIDFAGSSVFYHIYEGQKVFLVLPPTEKNLETYERWSMDPEMNTTFFPRLCDDPCMLVTLNKGDTMFIPSGWIHAVYTPKDSLVIGGNFLTRSHYTKQMAIQKIEVVTDTKLNQRYPKYTTLMWHTLYYYLTKDPIPDEIDKALAHGRVLRQKTSRVQKGRPLYTRQELEGLPDLCNFLLRTALISCGSIKNSLRPGRPTLTARQIDAVKRAIPTPCSEDPLKWIKKFGRWCIWKRVAHKIEAVGERVPEWAQGKWFPEETAKKGPSKAEMKRLERLKIEEARRAEAPRREGLRVRMRASTTPGDSESSGEASASRSHGNTKTPKKLKRKGEADIESSSKKRGRPNKTPLKTPTGSKKTSTEDSAKKRKNKGKSGHIVEGGDGEAFTLKDGSIYVAKESNLGPARAGCQNCRMKKTGCKHKAEIAELVALLEANGGVLPTADNSGKGKGKATVKHEVEDDAPREPEELQPEADEALREAEERDQREDEARDGGDEGDDGDEETELEKDKGKLLDSLKMTTDGTAPMPSLDNEGENDIVRESSGAGSSNGQKRSRIDGDDHGQEHTPPKKVRGAKDSLGVSGRPAGFQGRKPSCEECKALKTKCHHDTWHLAKIKTPTSKPSRSSARRNSTIMPAKVTTPGIASRARRESTINSTNLNVPSASKPAKVSTRRKSAPATSRRKYAVASRSDPWRSLADDSSSTPRPGSQGDEVVVDDEQEELEDVIVCKKPMVVTSAVKVTASAIIPNDAPSPATPSLTSVIVASGPPSTPAKSIPPVALSSTNTSPLTENEFDLDLSILDEHPYKSRSRSSNTPDDPMIMAPPADFDDEPVAAPVTPTPAAAPTEVTPATTIANVTSSAVPAKYPNPAYRVHKPKVTYNRNNKNYKKKADEDEDVLMEGTADISSPKVAKTGLSMSPAAEKKASSGTSVNGAPETVEDGDISVEELKRLGTAADFGLRRRAGS